MKSPQPTVRIDNKDVEKFVDWVIKLACIVAGAGNIRVKDTLEDINDVIIRSLLTQGHCSVDDLDHMIEEFIRKDPH
jgi:hypothetical protein